MAVTAVWIDKGDDFERQSIEKRFFLTYSTG
jgi:hypothetical protein